jgi:hypothetical protein
LGGVRWGRIGGYSIVGVGVAVWVGEPEWVADWSIETELMHLPLVLRHQLRLYSCRSSRVKD